MPDNKKPTNDRRQWRGSLLQQDIVTHDDGTPVLEVIYRARIPLKGKTLDASVAQGKSISEQVTSGLTALPTVDRLIKRQGKVLRDEGFSGRRAQ